MVLSKVSMSIKLVYRYHLILMFNDHSAAMWSA